MRSEDIARMAAVKEPHCVTIIMPRRSPAAGRETGGQSIERAISKAADFLRELCTPEEHAALLAGLYELAAVMEQYEDPVLEGAGLYVSRHYKKLLRFPFPVREKLVIADAFALREALYLDQYAMEYLLLHINGKTVQCYKGSLSRLEEIRDGRFPQYYREEYEYSKPSRATSWSGSAAEKSFEKDKSALSAERLQQFYRQADKILTDYLGELPLVVAGPRKSIALLEMITRHQKNIIARVYGNYTHVSLKVLAEKAWPAVRAWIAQRNHAAVPELIGKMGSGRTAEGIRSVWNAAREGRAGKLLIEKDFTCTGFISNDGGLYLKPPAKPHRIVMDVPDEIMRMVLEKNGQVVLLENNDLDIHKHIALITRY